MKILVACEYSGTVRDAFISKGHEAMSCDLLPSDKSGPHYQGDVYDILDKGWDMMIAFPPCTHLAVSGARWFKYKKIEQEEALEFVRMLFDAPIKRIAIENPVGIISTKIRKPDQIIQPWQFGHSESKKTCLWLKNLPLLEPTKIVEPELYGCKCGHKFSVNLGKYGCANCNASSGPAKLIFDNQTPSGQNNLPPGLMERAKIRSKTYQGIADAMAEQWGLV